MGLKVAIIADTHAGVRNDNPFMLENFKNSCRWFFDTIRDQGVKDVIHLGDLFDRHKYVNFITAKTVREELIEPLSRRGHDTHIILGNHDQYFKNTHEVNSLREMVRTKIDNVIVYDKISQLYIGDVLVLMVPWICESNRAEIEAELKKDYGKETLVFGHFEFTGFEMYKNTMPMAHGDDSSMYAKFGEVYSGHFHKKSSSGNIHYVGAFGEYTWSDHNCPRGFSILDLHTRQLEFFENPNRMFEQIDYDDVKNEGKEYQHKDYSTLKGKYVKVNVQNRTDLFSFDVMMDKISESEPADLVVDDAIVIEDEESDIEIDDAADTPTLIDSYIDNNNAVAISKERVKEYMNELYKEALMRNGTI